MFSNFRNEGTPAVKTVLKDVSCTFSNGACTIDNDNTTLNSVISVELVYSNGYTLDLAFVVQVFNKNYGSGQNPVYKPAINLYARSFDGSVFSGTVKLNIIIDNSMR